MRALGTWVLVLIVSGLLALPVLAQQPVQVQVQSKAASNLIIVGGLQQQVQLQVQGKGAFDPKGQVLVVIGAGGQAQVVRTAGGGWYGNKFGLLQLPSVQQDVKLTADQLAKLKELVEKQNQLLKDPPKDQNERLRKTQELYQANEKAVDELLKPEQVKRLKQITLQQQGEYVFSYPDVMTTLKLTAEQKTLLREIQQDAARSMQSLYQQAGGNYQEVQKALTEHRKATLEVMLAILTLEQTMLWKELVGEPFKGDLSPGRFARGIVVQQN